MSLGFYAAQESGVNKLKNKFSMKESSHLGGLLIVKNMEFSFLTKNQKQNHLLNVNCGPRIWNFLLQKEVTYQTLGWMKRVCSDASVAAFWCIFRLIVHSELNECIQACNEEQRHHTNSALVKIAWLNLQNFGPQTSTFSQV